MIDKKTFAIALVGIAVILARVIWTAKAREGTIVQHEADFFGCIEITVNHNVAWCYDRFIKPLL